MSDRAPFFAAIRLSLFDGRLTPDQVRGIEGILDAFAAVGDGRRKTLAYALATAHHETGRLMVPVREGFAATDARARRIVAGRRYGRPVGPHGHVYYGRGHVQLTWAENYKRSSADAGVDLFADPDKALDPVISARLLTLGLLDGRWNGLGKGIAHYLPESGPDDLQGARRTVNVTDRWQLIGSYYGRYLAALELGDVAPVLRPVVPKPAAAPVAPDPALQLRALAEWRAGAPDLAPVIDWMRRMPL